MFFTLYSWVSPPPPHLDPLRTSGVRRFERSWWFLLIWECSQCAPFEISKKIFFQTWTPGEFPSTLPPLNLSALLNRFIKSAVKVELIFRVDTKEQEYERYNVGLLYFYKTSSFHKRKNTIRSIANAKTASQSRHAFVTV